MLVTNVLYNVAYVILPKDHFNAHMRIMCKSHIHIQKEEWIWRRREVREYWE